VLLICCAEDVVGTIGVLFLYGRFLEFGPQSWSVSYQRFACYNGPAEKSNLEDWKVSCPLCLFNCSLKNVRFDTL
jgi:hypothetical protein